jgi:hypothetical protein
MHLLFTSPLCFPHGLSLFMSPPGLLLDSSAPYLHPWMATSQHRAWGCPIESHLSCLLIHAPSLRLDHTSPSQSKPNCSLSSYCPLWTYVHLILFCFCCFWDRVSLCSLDWPQFIISCFHLLCARMTGMYFCSTGDWTSGLLLLKFF